jgi:hypothetical protein
MVTHFPERLLQKKINTLVDSIRIHIFASFKYDDMKRLTLSTMLAMGVLVALGQSIHAIMKLRLMITDTTF